MKKPPYKGYYYFKKCDACSGKIRLVWKETKKKFVCYDGDKGSEKHRCKEGIEAWKKNKEEIKKIKKIEAFQTDLDKEYRDIIGKPYIQSPVRVGQCDDETRRAWARYKARALENPPGGMKLKENLKKIGIKIHGAI